MKIGRKDIMKSKIALVTGAGVRKDLHLDAQVAL